MDGEDLASLGNLLVLPSDVGRCLGAFGAFDVLEGAISAQA